MKDPHNPLDQLFEAARQQPPAVSVQELRSLLGAVPPPLVDPGAASAGSGTAGGAGAIAGKTTTALLTTKSIAMLTSIVSTALIGTALWVQDASVRKHNTTGSGQTQLIPIEVQGDASWLGSADAVPQGVEAAAAPAADDRKPKKAKKQKAASEAAPAAPEAEAVAPEQPTAWQRATVAPYVCIPNGQQTEWKKDEKNGQWSYSTQSGQGFNWTYDYNKEETTIWRDGAGQPAAPGTPGTPGSAGVPVTPDAAGVTGTFSRPAIAPVAPAAPRAAGGAREPVAPAAPRAAVIPREPAAPREPVAIAPRAPQSPRIPEPARKPEPPRKPEAAGAAAAARAPEPVRKPGDKNWPQGATVTVSTSKPERMTAKAINPTRFVRLQPKELEELGIFVSERELRYRNIVSEMAPLPGEAAAATKQAKTDSKSMYIGTMLDLAFTGRDNLHVDAHKALADKVTNVYPAFISEGENMERIKYKLRHEPNHKLDKGYFDEIEQTLVPVLVESKHGLDGKVVFWFSLTPAFLHTLPEREQAQLESQYGKVLAAQAQAENHKALRAEVDKEEEAQLKALEKRYSGLRSVEMGEVFPNPAREQVWLRMEFKQAEKIHVNLLDVKGRQVSQLLPEQDIEEGLFSRQLKLNEVSPGLYLVVVESAKGERWSQRLVVE